LTHPSAKAPEQDWDFGLDSGGRDQVRASKKIQEHSCAMDLFYRVAAAATSASTMT
jgi:hypothetical protein